LVGSIHVLIKQDRDKKLSCPFVGGQSYGSWLSGDTYDALGQGSRLLRMWSWFVQIAWNNASSALMA